MIVQRLSWRLRSRHLVWAVLVFFFIFLMVSLSPQSFIPHPAYAYLEPTHQIFNEQGALLVKQQDASDKIYEEIYWQAHIDQLREGAEAEDRQYAWVVPTTCDDGRFMRHFYKPGAVGANGLMPIDGNTRCTDAVTWARSSAGDPQADEDLTWTGAIDTYDYTDDSKEEAYLRVGHVAHLIGDMAQPEHVHLHPHPFQDYEGWARDQFPSRIPPLGSLTIASGNRMEDFLINMANITYDASTFQGGTLAESNPPIPLTSEFAQMFFVEWSGGWLSIDQWDLYNYNASGGKGTHLGNWDGDYGLRVVNSDDEWWETSHETGAGAGGFFTVEGDLFLTGIPAVYKGAPNSRTLGDIYLSEFPKQAIGYIAGLYQHFHDIVNHPPFVYKVKVTQAGKCMYESYWDDDTGFFSGELEERELEDDCDTDEDERWINGEDGDVEIVIEFGSQMEPFQERVKDVEVRIAGQVIEGELNDEENTWTGSFTPPEDGSMDGEHPIEIIAKDKQNHFTGRNYAGDELDTDPATPAKAQSAEPYNWEGYEPGTDTNHKIKIEATPPQISIQRNTIGPRCDPQYEVKATVTDPQTAEISELARVTSSGESKDPASGSTVTVKLGTVGVGGTLNYFVEAEDKAGNKKRQDGTVSGPPEPPGCDHSDDNYSAASPDYQVGTTVPLNTEPTQVAVLSNGFAPDASGFVNALREPNILVPPDFSPDIVEEYPLLVIPTGGLYGLENSAFFRARLEEYANRGGTIIVFDQQHGADYSVLPGGSLEGYGWAEDNSCTLSSLYIQNYDQVVSGFEDAILDSNVDGYFTDLPEDTDVLLYRSKNGQPAMVRYEYGNGTIIATTAYDDWGVTNWQTTADAFILNRDLLAWAVDPALLPEFDPDAAVSLPVFLTNQTTTTAASVELSLLAPGKQIVAVETQPVTLAAGSAMSVTFNTTANRPVGIWRVDYALLDSSGQVIQARQPGERFVVKNPHPLSAPIKEVALTVNAPTEDFVSGSNGEFTFTVYNQSNVTRTLQVRYGLPHHTWETGDAATYGNFSNLSRTVVVGPNSQAQFIHIFPMRTNDRLFAYLYENGSLKDQTWFQTRKTTASATAAVTMGQAEYGRNQTVTGSILVTNLSGVAATFQLDVLVTAPDGTEIFTATYPLPLSSGGTQTEAFNFVLPDTVPNGTFRVKADLTQSGAKVSGTVGAFALPQTPAAFNVSLPTNLPTGAGDPLQVVVSNPHAYLPVTGTLGLVATAPNGISLTLPAQPYALTAGGSTTLTFDVTGLPAVFGLYRFSFSSADQYSERTWEKTGNVALNTDVQFNQRTYAIRETLGMTITVQNEGNFGVVPQIGLDIPDLAFTDAQDVPLNVGQTAVLTYALSLPTSLAPDFHDVLLTAEVGTAVTTTHQFFIPNSRVIATLDILNYQAGDTPQVILNNFGGVDAPVTATLQLIDQYGVNIAETAVTTTVLALQTTPISLTIPTGAASGTYLLLLKGQNTATTAPVNLQRNLVVAGVAADLTVQTGYPAYFSDEQIATFSEILMASSTLDNGNLNLRICTANSSDSGASTAPPKITYTSQTVPFNWIDIASGGSVVARGSNTTTLVNLGFSFQFYGTTYTQMYVSSNGFVSFGSSSTSNANAAIPSISTPNNAIYALWDYLYPIGGTYGSVYVQQLDATRYVVQWQNVSHCCSTGSPETFQLILDSSDNSITLQYLDVTSTGGATVGVENALGTAAVQISNNQTDVIADGTALKLTTNQIEVEQTTYTSASTPFNWVDIASGGAVVAQSNDTNTLVNIGFPFQFYGTTYTQMYVGSNGFITFGSGNSSGFNTSIPGTGTPNNAIYALWDDLYPIGTIYGNVYLKQIDATHTVVQWENVGHCCSASNPETFQVILDGSDNSITLQYLDVTTTNGATVGVENSTGTVAVQLAYNQSGVIADGTAFKLTPGLVNIPDTNYSSAATAYNWVDIAPTGDLVAFGNDTYSVVDLGFDFEFYGNIYNQVYVDSNGFISFDYTYGNPYNSSIPSPYEPNNAVYGLWTDLYPVGGDYGAVFAQQVDATRYIIQWQAVAHCCSPDAPETFQIILDGSDNSVTLQYQDVSDTSSATAGVENATGSNGIEITNIITDNLAIRFATITQTVTQTGYISSSLPLNWHDISATGVITAVGDDTYSVVDIGFPFQFYGITYTQLYVGSNGYVSFGDGYTSYSTEYIPTPNVPNNAIYAFWDDLYPAGAPNGNVYTEQISPTLHVIQWEAVSHCCSPGSPETFQIVLDGSDNTITLQYLDLTSNYNALVGVENAEGTAATLVAYGEPQVITDGVAIQLAPIEQAVEVTSYTTATVPLVWENIGTADGTQIFMGSNTYMPVDLGFPFAFYGITQTQMYIGSNGFVSFEEGYTHSSNGSLPSTGTPNNAIYALWDYLYPVGGAYGAIYARQISPTHYVVQWEGVEHCCSTGSPETFQIVLDGTDNTITLQYEDVSLTSSATVGVENRPGNRATQIAYNQSGVITDGTAFKLTPDTQYLQVSSYLVDNVALNWQEIAPADGTTVLAASNSYMQVNLGFPFVFYGITQTQLYVGSNGFVSFESGYTNSSNGSLPGTTTPNHAIYALWDSLYPIGGVYGQVYARQTGPAQYVVQWEGVAHCCSTGSPETFQIVLDGTDSTITLQYEDVTLTNSATAGVEDRYGVNGTQLVYNQSGIIVDGLAWKLTPSQQIVLQPSYDVTPITLDWEEIAPAPGTEVVAVGSNTYTQMPLGFPFKFYGQTFTDVYVGSEGYVTFGSGNTSSANVAIPNYLAPNNAIFALWDDLNPTGGANGQVYVRQTSATQYVIQWQGVTHCCSGTSPESFEIVLDGNSNSITLQYEDVSLTNSATVGVENEFGTRGTQIAYNQSAVIVDGLALQLNPVEEQVPPPPICDPTVPQPMDLVLVIDRSGSMSGQPMADAKFAAKAFVDFMDLTIDRVGLASFSSSATLDHVLTQDGEAVKARIDTLIASGSTAIGEGTAVAHSHLIANATPGVTPIIVLLSDGQNNAGRDPLTAANAAKADGIKIVTIGLGSGADQPLLRAMASSEDDYHFAPSSDDLEEIFTSIANSICRSPLPYDASCGGYVLWEKDVPVSVATSLDVSELVAPLNVNGRMNLNGRLYAQTGQILTADNYPFYLHDRDSAITLDTDRDFYHPGDLIQVSGEFTNTSTLTVTTMLRVWADETLLIDQPLTLGPGAAYSYATVFTDTADLDSTNLNFIASANEVSVYRLVIVDEPQLQATLEAPAVVGQEPFLADLTITNTGIIPLTINAAILNVVTDTLTLPPGGMTHLLGTLSITQDTTLVAPITGDVTQTLTQPVLFGEAATVTFTPEPVYPVGPVDIPYLISNTGLLPVSFDTQVILRNSSGAVALSLVIPADLPVSETVTDALHAANLVAGNYTVEYTYPFGADSKPFTVVPFEDASLTGVAGVVNGITVPVTATVTNTGITAFTGEVTLETEFFKTSVPVMDVAVGGDVSLVLPVDTRSAVPGSYPAQLTLLNTAGTLIDQTAVTLSVPGPDLVLTSLPTNLTLPVSQTVTLSFGVTNQGATAGAGLLRFTFSDLVDEEQYIWLAAGESGTVNFTFFVPPGIEARTYPATYEFNGEPGVLLLTVEGIEIGVTPSLDKAGYYEGETALLTLHIEELANRPTQPLYALVRFNDYSEIQPFNLIPSGSVDLTFSVPVSFLGDDKVFYGIYDLATERSIHLNTIYLPRLYPDVTLLTDKQVYLPGETVNVTVVTTATGQLEVVAPGFADTITLTGANTGFSFVLPASMARGTYSVDGVPQNCGCINEGETLRTPFDVAAPEVRIVDAYLDQVSYQPGETIELHLTVASDQPIPVRFLTWVERPDGSLTTGPEQLVNLAASPANLLTAVMTLDTDQTGMHRVIYRLVDPVAADVIHGRGAETFDVGKAFVVAVQTDKTTYLTNADPIEATVMLYATEALNGQLVLTVDGTAVHSQNVSLVAGFQEIVIILPGGYGRGSHDLRATLNQGGLTSWRETQFDYATQGPDLIGFIDMPANVSAGTAQVVVTIGNRGDGLAAPSTATLYDGDPSAGGTVIASFAVPEMGSGASYETTLPWSAAGRAGENLLVLVADSGNDLDELDETNNEARETVTVSSLSYSLSSDRETYYRSHTALLTTDLANLSNTDTLTNLTLETTVYWLNGAITETVLFSDTRPLPDLAPNQTLQETISWAIADSVAAFNVLFEVRQRVLINGVPAADGSLMAQVVPVEVAIQVLPEPAGHYPLHNEIPTIYLTASDTTADIDYWWGEESPLPYIGPFAGLVGTNQLKAYAQENGIVIGPTAEKVVNVDMTPPQTTVFFDPPVPNGQNGWYTIAPTITFTATDNGVGVTMIQYGPGNDVWFNYASPFQPERDDEFTMYYRAVDWVGNYEEAQTTSFKLDRAAPTLDPGGPHVIDEGQTVVLDGSATDSTSGLDFIVWDVDGDGTYTDPDPASVTFPNGPFTDMISAAASDLAGNVAISETQVIVNNVPPTVTAASDVTTNVGTPINLTVAAFSDPGVLDTHTATIDWGDSTVEPGTVNETNGSGSVTDVHTYQNSGNFTVVVEVCDEVDCQSDSFTVTVTGTAACDLYPISMHTDVFAGVPVGTIIPDVREGDRPGKFGWLTWTGDNGTPVLVESLTPPGNSHTYINPHDPTDHVLNTGDWVEVKPGVVNSQRVRDALDVLKTIDIVLPVWDTAEGTGANTNFHVVSFATIRLIDYNLAGHSRLTVQFLGYTTCNVTVGITAVEGVAWNLSVPAAPVANFPRRGWRVS